MLFAIGLVALTVIAQPMDNFDPFDLEPHPQFPRGEAWYDESAFTLWDAGALDNGLDAYLEIDSSSHYDISNANQIGSQDASSTVTPPVIPYLKRERKGRCFVKKEIWFARAKLQRKDLTWEEWQALLEKQDPIAVQIKRDFDDKCEYDSKYAQLMRKLKKDPTSPYLLKQLKSFNKTKEDFERQRKVAATRPHMSKTRRDKVNKLINKIRSDMEEYRVSGDFRPLRSTQTEKQREKALIAAGKRKVDPRYVEGNAVADEIIDKMEEFRRLIREAPLDESLWGDLWQQIDEWMRENQHTYIPLTKPCIDASWGILHDALAGGSDATIQEEKDLDEDDEDTWGHYLKDDLSQVPFAEYK